MIRGVPTGMTANEIREELLQNLNTNESADLKVMFFRLGQIEARQVVSWRCLRVFETYC